LILGIAAKRNIEGIGLFGEIDNPNVPQNPAARSIVKVIARMINMEINAKELETQDDNIDEEDVQKERTGFTPGVA
ncbi:MAG: PAC2 family protein, partial [Nitrososphaerales archaeon]